MWAIKHVLEPCTLLFISNVCLKYAPKWMVSSSIFQKFSGEGLTEPPHQTPPPVISRASLSVRASPSILRRFEPSNRASPSILGRFAPSIRASPSTFGWKLGLAPQNKFLDPPLRKHNVSCLVTSDVVGVGLPSDRQAVSIPMLGNEIVVGVTFLTYGGNHGICCLWE